MIDNNYNMYNPPKGNVSYGAVKDVVPENINSKLPENVQNLDAVEIASNNGAVSAAQGANSASMLATLPIYALFVGLRSINDSPKSKFSFAGDYEKSFLGKLSKLGDTISNGVSKVVPKKVSTGVSNGLKNAKEWLVGHSAIARSFTTPLKLESSMALSEANGLFGRVILDDVTLFEKGYKGDVKALFKGDGTSSFWNLLKSKGIESADGEKALKIVTDTFNDFKNKPVKSKEMQQYVTDIVEALSKSDECAVIDKWGKFGVGKIPGLGKALTLKVPMKEVANKLRVSANIPGDKLATGAAGAAVGTTALGRALPSAFAKIYEGFTSDFVGGKLAPVLQAYFVASAAVKAKDAPKGQKLATFMDEESSAVSFLFTMPLATSLMTKAGGLKYLGMGETREAQGAAVSKFRDMVKNLNAKVDAKTISRGEYAQEVKNIKKVLNGNTKWWQKPLKAIGKVLGANYQAETIKPFIDDKVPADMGKLKSLGVSVSNKVQSMLYKLKTNKVMTPAGMLRFALVMFVLSPIVSKPIKWAVNKIFGKPYDPEKEKQEQEKKAKEDAIKNNPFTKMTDEELVTLLSQNKETMEKIQNDPELMKELQTNPQKLYDMLQEGAKQREEALKNAPMSPALQNYINSRQTQQQGYTQPQYTPQNGTYPAQNSAPAPSNGLYTPNMNQNITVNNNGGLNQNSGMNLNTNAKMPSPSVQTQDNTQEKAPAALQPKRSYIPSSKPAEIAAGNAKNAQFDALIADIDKTEKEYSKYLGI